MNATEFLCSHQWEDFLFSPDPERAQAVAEVASDALPWLARWLGSTPKTRAD